MNSIHPTIDSHARSDRTTLERRWAAIDAVRHELASELAKVGELIGGLEQRQIMRWSDWFRTDDHDLDDALARPDILAIVTPIFEQATDDEITAIDISQIAQQSFQLVNFNHSISRRMWKIVQYPVAIVLLLFLLWLCFMVTLAPELRAVFESFGIKLPVVSRLILGEMPHLHIFSWVLTAAALIVAITWLATNWRRNSNPPNSTWLDKRLMTTRCAVGIWAWHTSLLMRIGIDSIEAVVIASRATKNAWVKKRAEQWLKAAKSNPAGAVACLGPFDKSPFPMANSAIVMSDPNQKSSFLQQTAIYYNDRARVVGDWWFRILAWLILWNAFLAGVIFFVTLYGSLYSIMRGLLYWW